MYYMGTFNSELNFTFDGHVISSVVKYIECFSHLDKKMHKIILLYVFCKIHLAHVRVYGIIQFLFI